MNCPTGAPTAVAPNPAESVPRTFFGAQSAKNAYIGVWIAFYPNVLKIYASVRLVVVSKIPSEYRPMPATNEPQKIQGVRLPKRDLVLSERVPQIYPTNNDTSDVTDVITP